MADDIIDIVPNIDGYEGLPTPMLQRMAAGGDEGAQWELDRRQPPPPKSLNPDEPPKGSAKPVPFYDAVVNDQPYYAMPVQLLRNLVAEGNVGAAEELKRRGLPAEPTY